MGSVTNRDDIMEVLAAFMKIEDTLCLVPGNVYSHFSHHPDRQRVQGSFFQSGTCGLKPVTGQVVQEGFSHLAAGGIVDTYEQKGDLLHWLIGNQANE